MVQIFWFNMTVILFFLSVTEDSDFLRRGGIVLRI